MTRSNEQSGGSMMIDDTAAGVLCTRMSAADKDEPPAADKEEQAPCVPAAMP